MPALTASLWTRALGVPRRLATLVAAESGAQTVSYDGGAIKDRLPGLSIVHDLAMVRDVVYPPSYANLLPPALAELAPPPHPAGRVNPQRAIVETLAQRVYADRGWHPANAQQREWDLLLLCGRGSVGVLDVFSSDEQAASWYATPTFEADLLKDQDGVAAMFRAVVASSAMVSPELLGGGRIAALPSLGGMMPKTLARFNPATERVTLDLGGGAPTARPGIPVVVKIEPSGYEGIVELEALAYRACAAAGLAVPRTWVLRPPEFRPMLVVERVDIGADGQASAMETVFAVLFEASGFRVHSADAAPYEMVAAALRAPNILTVDDRAAAGLQLFRQVLVSLLIGNGDLHLRNLALLGTRAGCRLAPVYDPAPMRAWYDHDIVSACNLGGLSLDRAVAPPELGNAVVKFAAVCGLASVTVATEMDRCMDAGRLFLDDVRGCGAPEERRQNLIRRATQVREVIGAAVPLPPAPRRRRKAAGDDTRPRSRSAPPSPPGR